MRAGRLDRVDHHVRELIPRTISVPDLHPGLALGVVFLNRVASDVDRAEQLRGVAVVFEG